MALWLATGATSQGQLGIGNRNDIPMTSVAVPVGPFQGTVIGVRASRTITVLWTATQLYVVGFFNGGNFGGDRLYSDDRESVSLLVAPFSLFTLALTTTEQIVNVYVVGPNNAIMVHLASGLTLTSATQSAGNFPNYAYRTSEDISGDAAVSWIW